MRTVAGTNFLSVKEAAQRLGIAENTVRKLIKEERLKAKRVGKGYLISEDTLKAFLVE